MKSLAHLTSLYVSDTLFCTLIQTVVKLVAFESHTGNVSAVAFHSEGKWLVTASEDGTIKVWDLRWVYILDPISVSALTLFQHLDPPSNVR